MVFPYALNGQVSHFSRWENYAAFQEDYRIDTSKTDQFIIRFRNTNFFKNNEYASEFRTGQSITGLFLQPVLDYYAGPRTRIRAGVHLLKYNGRDEIERSAPILTIHHAINSHISMVFGTIYGTVNHGLKEPMYGFEKYLLDNYENGMQLLMDYDGFTGDLWLNWEQFIKEGDPFQEKFTAGFNTYFDLLRNGSFSIGVPFQALFRHKGGQIDNTTIPAGTQSNLLQGIKVEWNPGEGGINRIIFEQNWLHFVEINPGRHIEIPYGYGNYSVLRVGVGLGEFSLGYWRAKDFDAPHGEGLFLPYSDIKEDFYMAEREVISIKYQYHHSINDFLDFVLRIEPYYHCHSGRIDHSFGVFLLVDKEFFLAGGSK